MGAFIKLASVLLFRGRRAEYRIMEFTLNETDAAGRANGREVHYANSNVLVSPATPLFGQIGAPA